MFRCTSGVDWICAPDRATLRDFFFNDTATTEIYTLSLHDALPISPSHGDPARPAWGRPDLRVVAAGAARRDRGRSRDRKSTRLNSSHGYISYAVFCLKKKKKHNDVDPPDVSVAERRRLHSVLSSLL